MSPSRAVVAVAVLATALTASAATLGGVASASLGADRGVSSSCDSDGVGVSYDTDFDAVSGGYRVTSVVLSDLAAPCAGRTFTLTLASAPSEGSPSASEVSGTLAPVAGAHRVVLASPVSAEDLAGASLLLTD